MSSVTRRHLLSQSMLNVSCQKQKPCSSLPTDSPTESPMESVGQLRPVGACSLLGVPALSTVDLDLDDDEGEIVIGIRPKSSPLPRRRSSVSDEDSEPEPPLSGSRRVSFADAKGLSLVQVKEFDTWDVPKLPGCDSTDSDGIDAEEYLLSPLTFSLPLSTEELFVNVREQKVELETIELLPGTTILKGVIRVLNISFTKAVYIRTTLDSWSTHFDLLAEYIPGSSDSLTDCFSFRLTLVPPFGEQGARVDFCLRYETPVGTFWANNNNRNYVLLCHQREKERKEEPQRDNVNRKSCLKTVSQNFPTVEDISASEAASQENIPTDVSTNGERTDAVKTKQIPDGQSGASEEVRQKLQAENRQNCSRRNRRRAARMARVRDRFAQRGGGANDQERDESPPQAKEKEKPSNVQSVSEMSSKSEEPSHGVVNDTSPAHDCTSSSAEKSESASLADSATLTGGESATDIPDDSLHSNPALAEHQNINMSVYEAKKYSEKQDMTQERTSNIATETTDSIISSSSERLASNTSSFTFGTVVAPLYHQVSGKVGNESQSGGDQGNPVHPAVNVGDLTQSYPESERGDTSCTVHTGADKVEACAITTEESKQEFIYATQNSPPVEEEKSSIATDTQDHLQDNVDSVSGDTIVQPHNVDILKPDSLNLQISSESLHLQGEAQEENPTPDLQSQTTAETAPEPACAQIDETCAQNKTEEVATSSEASFMSLSSCKFTDESTKDDDKTVTVSTNSGMPVEDKLEEALQDLNPNFINNSSAKETENSCVSCDEILEEVDVTAPQISPETHRETKDVEDENKEAVMSNYYMHVDRLVELREGDTLKDEEITVAEKMEPAVLKHEDYCIAGNAEVKNWEMMVEEEEINILTDEEEGETIKLTAEESDVVETHQEINETALENRDMTETEEKKRDEIVQKITTVWVKEAGDGDFSEARQMTGDEQIVETVAEKDKEEVEKELAKTAGKEELVEETEFEKKGEKKETELEGEKHYAEMQDVDIDGINVQEEEEEEEINGEEKIAVVLNDEKESGVEWEDQGKLTGESVEEESRDYNEEILVDETSAMVDAESESVTKTERRKTLDEAEIKAEDASFALVQEKRVTDTENTKEGQNSCIQIEMDLYKEEAFQSNVTHDLLKAARDESESTAAEGASWLFVDEPESDQLSHESVSASESDSDDEVELYMHCLRAVHAGEQSQKDRNKDTGFSGGKRPSISRNKLLSTPMPSITESVDEEQHLSCLQEDHEDLEITDFQSTAAALPASSQEQESINTNVSWWRETFSCRNISKTMLYATLFMVFMVVAYHYDFIACFGLYVISVIWLYCQGERQPVKNKNRIG